MSDDLDLFTPPERLGETFEESLDGARLSSATARVYALLRTGRVRTIEEVRAVGGFSGDRRARDLRDPRYGGGLPIEVFRSDHDPAVWLYRLNLNRVDPKVLERVDRMLLPQEIRP